MSENSLPEAGARISLVLPSLAGGGAERVNLRLAREFLTRGFSVDIVVMRAEGELRDMVPEGAQLHELGCSRARSVARPYARYLGQARPDAVVVNMWPLTAVCALTHRLLRSRARLVVVDHCAFSPASRHQRLAAWLLLRSTLALTCRLADARICVSAGLADEVARLAHYPRERVDVIYNPIEMPAVAGPGPTLDLWDGAAAKRILTAGRLTAQKNFPLLLEAFAQVVRQIDARLVILGDGPLRPEIERKVMELELDRRVRLPGFSANPAPAFHAADLFVLSSDAEGFGNVIVEALACGVPVVSTDCPSGPREILDDGAFGALVPCGDAAGLAKAMLHALTTAHDRDALKARAAMFNTARAADAYLRAAFGAAAEMAETLR